MLAPEHRQASFKQCPSRVKDRELQRFRKEIRQNRYPIPALCLAGLGSTGSMGATSHLAGPPLGDWAVDGVRFKSDVL